MANKKDAASFDILNYSAFENIVRPRCFGYVNYLNETGHKARSKANMGIVDMYVFLRSGFLQEDWDEHFAYKSVQDFRGAPGNMRSGAIEPFDYIINAFSEPDAFERVRDHLEVNLLPLLNASNKVAAINDLLALLNRDMTIQVDIYDRLIATYESGDTAAFFAQALITAVIRSTIPDRGRTPELLEGKYELFPRVEQVITEMEEAHSSQSFLPTLKWLAKQLLNSRNLSLDEEKQLDWNAVAFWKNTHEYIDLDSLDDDMKGLYEYIRKRSYLKEFHRYMFLMRDMAQDLRYGYDVVGKLWVKYSETERGGWSIEYANDFLRPGSVEDDDK